MTKQKDKNSRKVFYASAINLPVKENADELRVLSVYADGLELEAIYHGFALDTAVNVEIGWEQLAEVCATALMNLDEAKSAQFAALVIQRQVEALDALEKSDKESKKEV